MTSRAPPSRTPPSRPTAAPGACGALLAACILAGCAGCAGAGGNSDDRLLLDNARRQHVEAERAFAAAAPSKRSQPTASTQQPDRRSGGRRDGTPTRAIRFNRTLLYAPQWLRSDDIAETLAPLVQNLYGPGAAVISQTSSNRLGIYIPPREARDMGGAAGAATGPGRGGGVPSPRSSTRR